MISVLIPTKGRPEKLARCVRSIDVFCEILIVATDESDVPEHVEKDPRVDVLYDFDRKFSVVQAQNFMADRARFHLLPISDDIEFDKGSIHKAVEQLDLLFECDGVIGFKVRNMNCNDDAYMLVGREFYHKTLHRELFHSGYKHFYADTELGRRAKAANKFWLCEEATILNFHPNAGYPEDATHTHQRGEKLAHDQELYNSRVLHRQVP